MEELRDHENKLMIFYVRDELDFPETIQVKTWYSVGLALNAGTGVLNGIETCYRSQQSPTHSLMIPYFKTLGEKEPSMREFVNALLQCKRYDVAYKICHWPQWRKSGEVALVRKLSRYYLVGTFRSEDGDGRKRRWKSEFAFFQSSSRLLQVENFVKCRRTLLKLNS